MGDKSAGSTYVLPVMCYVKVDYLVISSPVVTAFATEFGDKPNFFPEK
jgi:hypothetical protein